MGEKLITEKSELAALLKPGKKILFRFDFPTFTPAENEWWYRAVQNHYKACGCEMSAFFIVGSFLLSCCHLAFGRFCLGRTIELKTIIALAVAIAFAAAAGKLLGIAIGKWRLKSRIRELTALVD